jgi:putative acetyltransferase
MKIVTIEKSDRNLKLVDTLISVWESSVKATHTFLSEDDISKLIPHVKEGIINIEKLIVVILKNDIYCAFMGVLTNKIEMLFVDEQFRSRGIGTNLLYYAIHSLNAIYVDVNEQNSLAISFYETNGFKVKSRSETDDYGNPFPILHMVRE